MVEALHHDPRFAKLGKYLLSRTLGKGAYSKVKLGLDPATNSQYAIKIHKSDSPDFT